MRRISLTLLCLLLSACAEEYTPKHMLKSFSDYLSGGADNTEPPTPLTEYTPEIEAVTIWDTSIGDGAGKKSLKLVPGIGGGKIIAADADGLVEAHDLTSGNQLWEVDIEDDNGQDIHFSSGPAVSQNTAILGSSDAQVVALNTDNGAVLWKTSVSSEVSSVPIIHNGIAIIRTNNGTIVALDEKTGQKIWLYESTLPALSVRGMGAPIIVGENIICGYDNGKLIALRLEDGKYVWETSVAIPSGRSEVERLIDLDVDPIEEGGFIYVASYQGGISSVTQTNGEVTWRNPDISSYTGFAKDFQYLYLSDSDGDVVQIDQQSGHALWKQKDLHQRKLTAPAVYGSYVVVGDYDGYVHWLSTTDGRLLGRTRAARAPIEAKPLVVDNTIYVYAKNGTLAALRADLPSK